MDADSVGAQDAPPHWRHGGPLPESRGGLSSRAVGADERWLDAGWPFVRTHVSPSPAAVLEVGCGPLGGFVPALRRDGHDATGVDPRAPQASGYHQSEFEQYQPAQQVDVVVASTSLHHVADLDVVLDAITAVLVPDGRIIVLEWAWEQFDEATASWCFERLDPLAESSWLRHRRDEWQAGGGTWDRYFGAWAHAQGLHSSAEIRRGLDERFHCQLSSDGPYFFPDLNDISEADEQAAIDSGAIRSALRRYIGRLRLREP